MSSTVVRVLVVIVAISAMSCASGAGGKPRSAQQPVQETTSPPQPPPPPPVESEPTLPAEEVPADEVPAEEIPAAPQPERTVEEMAAEDDSLTILPSINPARGDPVSLAEAAEAERERRQTADAPIAVITNKNLEEYATGELSEVGIVRTLEEPEAKEKGADDEEVKDETYWRTRARTIREEWREAVDAIEELEGDAAELRVRFYSEDDGFYRDSQIKPAWDRALMDLDTARRRVVEKREELEAFLEEGRRAGALPGWLREGIELEPEPEPRQTEKIHDVSEPVVVDEGGNGR